MSWVQVNKGRDIFPPAVFINGVSIMGGIQKELFDTEFRQVCFHGEKRVEEREHVMSGDSLQKEEYGKNAMRIGSHIHVEVVAEKIAFPLGIPAPVAVGLNKAVCSYKKGSPSLCSHRSVFCVAVRRCKQECHHQQEPDDADE